MILLHEHRWAFIDVPKCASQAIEHALRTQLGGVRPRRHWNRLPPECRGYQTFAVVRNPYERAISCWWGMCKKPHGDKYGVIKAVGDDGFIPYLRWVNQARPTRWPGFIAQSVWLSRLACQRSLSDPAPIVLRFESLAEGMRTLPFGVGLEIGRRNVSKDRPAAAELLNHESMELIQEWAGADFDHYGYSRGVPLPPGVPMRAKAPHRAALVRRLSEMFPNGPREGAEVGVLAGRTSLELLEAFPALRLRMVDHWGGQASLDRTGSVGSQKSLTLARTNTKAYAARRMLMRHDSLKAARRVADASLDFVFIDADHTYKSVRADLAAWAPKVKPGGLLCGHDYLSVLPDSRPNGVQQAVDEYATTTGQRVTLGEGYLWFFLPEVPACT